MTNDEAMMKAREAQDILIKLEIEFKNIIEISALLTDAIQSIDMVIENLEDNSTPDHPSLG